MRGPFSYVYVVYALFREDTRVKERTIRHAITHLLNKALPQRCQIRNLKEIVQQYIVHYPEIRVFIDAVFAPLGVEASAHIEALMGHQHMLFMFLKRFVVARVDECPPLMLHLQSRCNWFSFSESVKMICHRVTQTFQENLSNGVEPLEHIETIIIYMSRMQVRNIMSPCFMDAIGALLHYFAEDVVPVELDARPLMRDPMLALSTRILENYGMSTWGAHHVRASLRVYLKDSNKNALLERVATLGEHDMKVLRAAMKHIQSYRVVSAIPTPTRSDIRLYICDVCHDTKNTLTTFTSLRDIMYDAANDALFCVKKRNMECRSRPLRIIPMDSTYVVIGSKIYGICALCAVLYCTVASRYTNDRRLCSTCRSLGPLV